MNAILSPLMKYWPAVALLVSAAMLATAHYYEAQGYAPCTLCLQQREVYWVAMAVAAAALVVGRTPLGPRTAPAFDALLALVFLFGAGLAFYHSGVEWQWWPGPSKCASSGGAVTVESMAALLNGEEVVPPSCDKAVWFFLGLSMATWNGIVSLGLAGFGALAALRRGRP